MSGATFTWKRKLSALEIVGDNIKALFREWDKVRGDDSKLELFKVAGTLNDYEDVPTNFGDSTRLKGEFVAVNVCPRSSQGGEIFRANRLYLPDIMTEQLVAALASLKSNDPQAIIEFGFLVSIIPDEKSTTGYVFMSESLLETNKVDPLAKLAATLGIKLALPSPAKDTPALPPPSEPASGSKGKGRKAA